MIAAVLGCGLLAPVDVPEGTWELVGVTADGQTTGPDAYAAPAPGCPRSRTAFTFVRERLTVSHDALCEGAGGWWTCGAHLTVPVRWTSSGVAVAASGEGWGRLMPLEVHPTELDELPAPDTRCSVAVSEASFSTERSEGRLALRDHASGATLLLSPASAQPDLDGWRRGLTP